MTMLVIFEFQGFKDPLVIEARSIEEAMKEVKEDWYPEALKYPYSVKTAYSYSLLGNRDIEVHEETAK